MIVVAVVMKTVVSIFTTCLESVVSSLCATTNSVLLLPRDRSKHPCINEMRYTRAI